MSNNALQTIINARLPGEEGLWQIHLQDGKISAIDAQSGVMPITENSLDAEQGLVIPPFVEPHVTPLPAMLHRWDTTKSLPAGRRRFVDQSTAQLPASLPALLSAAPASHTTAMHSYNGAYTSRLFRLLKMSGINFVANPLVNIHLQGRFDTYPKRRGITRVKEMLESGINVCFGHDDVFDPWYPLGTANMLQVLHMGLHVCQLMGYGQINDGLNLITHHSARTLNLQDYGIAAGNSANLIILPAENGFDALRRQVPVRYSVRGGKVIASTQPAQTTVYLEQPEAIDYKR